MEQENRLYLQVEQLTKMFGTFKRSPKSVLKYLRESLFVSWDPQDVVKRPCCVALPDSTFRPPVVLSKQVKIFLSYHRQPETSVLFSNPMLSSRT